MSSASGLKSGAPKRGAGARNKPQAQERLPLVEALVVHEQT